MNRVDTIDKKSLSERDICTKYITPALQGTGWDLHTQIREEVTFTKGRVIVKGRLHSRGETKRADYILYHKPNIPVAVVEAKDNNHSVGDGMQQALSYAEILDLPFAFSSNGDAFLMHDRTGAADSVEQELSLEAFPAPDELWQRHCAWKGLNETAQCVVTQDYYSDGRGKSARYYQRIAINRAVEAIARGQDRILLVMATGTGKTFTAFQIIWRLWKAGTKKRILFLADRNILVDQTRTNDFKPFGQAMTKITKRQIDKSYEIYLALYQAVTGTEEEKNIYKQFSPDFFDLVVVDECHRGSAAEDSAWREILEYFSSATQIGMTATPKETKDVSTSYYFGDPVYTYSLRQGIEDGFLAPYKVVRIALDKDVVGWRPDGTLFGEGVKTRIKEKLLDECNVHTIVRLPNGVFNPYTGIKTNILFFTKGEPTKEMWFYEHPYPEGYKSYSKTKPIRIEEFDAEKAWWNERAENEHTWKVDFQRLKADAESRATPHWEAAEQAEKQADSTTRERKKIESQIDELKRSLEDTLFKPKSPKTVRAQIKKDQQRCKELKVEEERLQDVAKAERASGDAIYAAIYNLDIKNPHSPEANLGDPEELLADYQQLLADIAETRDSLKQELMAALGGKNT